MSRGAGWRHSCAEPERWSGELLQPGWLAGARSTLLQERVQSKRLLRAQKKTETHQVEGQPCYIQPAWRRSDSCLTSGSELARTNLRTAVCCLVLREETTAVLAVAAQRTSRRLS